MKVVGLAFARTHAGIRLVETKRVDLAVDRFSLRNSADIAAIEIGDPGRGRLRRVLEQTLSAPGSGGIFTEAQVDDAINRCRRLGLTCHHRDDIRKPRPVVAWRQPVIQRRRVLDPSISRAELLHQLGQHPDARWIGYQRSDVNLSELIGGFARVRKRTEAQTQAAAEYRNLAERAMLGGSKAVDLSAVRVDVSFDATNSIMVIGAEARSKLEDARDRLGDLATIVDRVIVGGESISELTLAIGWGAGARARDRATKMLLAAADELALEFGFIVSGKSSGLVSEIEVPTLFVKELGKSVISTRRQANGKRPRDSISSLNRIGDAVEIPPAETGPEPSDPHQD